MKDGFEYFISIEGHRIEEKVDRSLFISTASYVENEEMAKNFISKVSQEFKDATHNCWAYKIGNLQFYSDDGEPSNSAGRPIMDAIRSSKIEKVSIVVSRYFGGKKLGISGLIKTYSYMAKKVLEYAPKKRILYGRLIEIKCVYGDFDRIRYFIQKHGYIVSPVDFKELITIKAFLPLNLPVNFDHKDFGERMIEEEKLIEL
ncbi:IMPACT family protein [Athalassotoga saccharophila]|uniref:IMPACT family protein n=1 Tax=Athalassotoga saccharophila TaxID=1441386 RepID=UPI001379BEDA|nr:YigZ family protein [Athalassotoga saccharophila]BBJ27546.1 IMPACT family member YigZ [Athalassotoga saccharophila]